MVRQRLELEAGGGVGRVRVVADEVAAADLDRVHADRLRGEVDEPSVTEQAIGWPTARYWHITFLFWNTTRARAR